MVLSGPGRHFMCRSIFLGQCISRVYAKGLLNGFDFKSGRDAAATVIDNKASLIGFFISPIVLTWLVGIGGIEKESA